jgi:hypothetical protein
MSSEAKKTWEVVGSLDGGREVSWTRWRFWEVWRGLIDGFRSASPHQGHNTTQCTRPTTSFPHLRWWSRTSVPLGMRRRVSTSWKPELIWTGRVAKKKDAASSHDLRFSVDFATYNSTDTGSDRTEASFVAGYGCDLDGCRWKSPSSTPGTWVEALSSFPSYKSKGSLPYQRQRKSRASSRDVETLAVHVR